MSCRAASHSISRPWIDGRSTQVFIQAVGGRPSQSALGSAHQYQKYLPHHPTFDTRNHHNSQHRLAWQIPPTESASDRVERASRASYCAVIEYTLPLQAFGVAQSDPGATLLLASCWEGRLALGLIASAPVCWDTR